MSIDLAPKAKEGRAIYVLIPLLVLHLALLSMQIQDARGTLLFSRWVLVTEEPFIRASSATFSGIRYLWTSYVWLHGARAENQQLQARVRELTLQLDTLEQARQENERLHQLLGMTGNIPRPSVTAHVVGRTPDFMSNTLYLDRGWEAGIAYDSAVLSTSGVIGRVIMVTRYHCQVQLITNADASTGVMVDRTRTPGVLKGTGNPVLNLDYISNSEQINPGDLIVSSGLDGIYPKGFAVGKVVESHKGKSVFRSIQVEPSADMLHVEEVLVLPATRSGGAADFPGLR